MRAQFPSQAMAGYLDTAAIGVAPQVVVDAIAQVAFRAATSARGGDHHQRLVALREAARIPLARLLGASPDDIAFVESATHGLLVAAQALPLDPGDRVLMGDIEFLQMGSIWRQMQPAGIGVDVMTNRRGRIDADAVVAGLTPRTRVLAISSVQWTNGYRTDLEAIGELCRQRGVLLLVDAAQHIGMLPFDVGLTPVDVLVASGHKWLGSPFGSGVLYLSPTVREKLRMPITGFLATRPPLPTWGDVFADPRSSPFLDLEPGRSAQAWEIGGTGNVAGAVALAAAADLVSDLAPYVAGRVLDLGARLIDGLDRLGFEVVSPRAATTRSGITTFTTGTAAQDSAMVHRLRDAGVTVSQRYSSGVGGVRVSTHWANTDDDIDALLGVSAPPLEVA